MKIISSIAGVAVCVLAITAFCLSSSATFATIEEGEGSALFGGACYDTLCVDCAKGNSKCTSSFGVKSTLRAEGVEVKLSAEFTSCSGTDEETGDYTYCGKVARHVKGCYDMDEPEEFCDSVTVLIPDVVPEPDVGEPEPDVGDGQ